MDLVVLDSREWPDQKPYKFTVQLPCPLRKVRRIRLVQSEVIDDIMPPSMPIYVYLNGIDHVVQFATERPVFCRIYTGRQTYPVGDPDPNAVPVCEQITRFTVEFITQDASYDRTNIRSCSLVLGVETDGGLRPP